MAKQNVTFIERHVEKIVAGVAGAGLLVVVALYLIDTPHKTEVNGENLGPQAFYARIREQAEQARLSMKSKQPGGDGDAQADLQVPDINAELSPYDRRKLPKEVAVAFAPLKPAVPVVEAGPRRGRIRLAELLPPGPVGVTTGRSYAALVPPEPIRPGGKVAARVENAVTQDWHWVSVFAVVHRKAQRDKFREAKYEGDRQNLIVAAVEAERQERLPDGKWGEGELIQGYAPAYIPVREQVNLEQGTYAMLEQDRDYILAYRKALESKADQAAVLRPDFQSLLPYAFDWVLPDSSAGFDFNMVQYGVSIAPDAQALRGARSGRAAVGRMETAATEAIARGDYIEADQILNEIKAHADATSRQVSAATAKLKEIESEVQKAREEKILSASRQEGLGDDVEPLWLNDLSVIPGKTYRYRVRLLVFNAYVGLVPKLEKPEDAAKIVLPGKWSEWSEAIRVEPDVHLFLTSGSAKNSEIKLELHQWSEGAWRVGREKMLPGDVLDFTVNRKPYSCGSLVAGVDWDRKYRKWSYRSGRINQEDISTTAMATVTSDGQVQEHVAAMDNDFKRTLILKDKERQKLMDALEGEDRSGSRKPQRSGRDLSLIHI